MAAETIMSPRKVNLKAAYKEIGHKEMREWCDQANLDSKFTIWKVVTSTDAEGIRHKRVAQFLKREAND